jgi:iron complex outermembrane receptor protein
LTSRQIHRQIQVCATITLLTLLGLPGRSQQIPDLTQKSLEDLMSIEVTSVSKKEQKTSEAAAAVFVISREDIRRSGALNTYTFPPAVLARAAQLSLAESGCP